MNQGKATRCGRLGKQAFLSLALSWGLTGCTSFLAEHALKTYPAQIQSTGQLAKPNRYQKDFLVLKSLGGDVFPVADRYFPADQRAAMEEEILQKLGEPGCSDESFLMCVHTYLAAYNNQHAFVVYTPKDFQFSCLYPFRIHYESNDVVLLDLAREYDPALIGQKITAINNLPIAEVEQKLSSFKSGENAWSKRTSLEPFVYSQPAYYRLLGLSSSISNSIELAFASHPPVRMEPKWNPKFEWHGIPQGPHPITARSKHLYDCQMFPEQNYAYLQFNACFDKTAVLDGVKMVKPWIRPLVRVWLSYQFRRKQPAEALQEAYDPDRPVFKDYLAAVIRDMQRQSIKNLILDLRRNNGGEGELCNQLVYHLTQRNDVRYCREFQYNAEIFPDLDSEGCKAFRSWYRKEHGVEPPLRQLLPTQEPERPEVTDPKSPFYVAPDRPVFEGRVIVLANQHTQSAASELAVLLQDNGLAAIVGTTTANLATGPTGMTPFKLPRSGIIVSMPTEYYERPQPSKGDLLQPDYWVENSVADIRQGRDAVFEKALELLRR